MMLIIARVLWGVPIFDPEPTPGIKGESSQQWFERATANEQSAWVRWAKWFPCRLMLGVFGPQAISAALLGWESTTAVAISFTSIVYGFASLDMFRLALRVPRWVKQ